MSVAFRIVATCLFVIAALGAITTPALAGIPLIPLGLAFWCLSTLVS